MENFGQLWQELRQALGIEVDPRSLDTLQVCLRALVIYISGLVILRVGKNRFLGRFTAFDIILGFVLGSILSRAINGSGPLWPSIAATILLVGLHFLLAKTAFHSHTFGQAVKGRPELLVRDGEVLWDHMRRQSLSIRDLEEALRINGKVNEVSRVQEARFERNGDISVLLKKQEPRVIEVAVRDGVQTVRIEIG